MKKLLLLCSLAGLLIPTLFPVGSNAQTVALEPAPQGLRVDLLEHTQNVWQGGRLVNLTLSEALSRKNTYQFASIQSRKPNFSWELRSYSSNISQTAYEVQVASSQELLKEGKPDLWESGKVESSDSLSILYAGKELEAGKVYYWQVRSWNNGEESQWSNPKAFLMAEELTSDYEASRYPIEKIDEHPVMVLNMSSENSTLYVADFERAAFGTLRLTLTSPLDHQEVTVRLGEALKDERIDPTPGGTIRYAEYTLNLSRGTHTYQLQLRPDRRNTGAQAIKMPDYIGEVLPFRYCEIQTTGFMLGTPFSLVREAAYYPFNETSSFQSDLPLLNQIWDLCRYSIKMTSFCGTYVDGDRERIPYEADALINQLSHYAVDNEYSLGRLSHEYLITHATWPTEWILQSILIAWNDYLYTGDKRSLNEFYTDLQAKALLPLADKETLFISTRTGMQTPELIKSIHYSNGNEIRDIVDWPQGGSFGQDDKPGESDGFVFKDVNTVVNAYHYQALKLMGQIATVLGQKEDAVFYSERASKLMNQFNQTLLSQESGIYLDGIGTDHSALHSNMFPLAFGMVPEAQQETVMKFIRSKGMACSVYGSQFLMDAIYEADDSLHALERLTAKDDRSWYNMMNLGSTVTLEAWDNKYKNNLDWNHAWGSAPANIIMRKLVGVEPLEAGFGKITLKPQIATLKWVKAQVPTIRGCVGVEIHQQPEREFALSVEIPAGMKAQIYLPNWGKNDFLPTLDGTPIAYREEGKYIVLENIGSGAKKILLRKN